MRDADAALDRWQCFGGTFTERPRVIRQLGGGLTNRSFLIAAGRQRYVLRLNSPQQGALGIDRLREQRILADAVSGGIAPVVHYHSITDGILISDFIDGMAPDLRDTDQRDALIEVTRRIHSLTTPVDADDYYAHAERYRTQLDAAQITLPRSLEALGEQIRREQENNLNEPGRLRICHRDLTPGNVIDRDGRLYVIDWEYATRGNPSFDFAAISVEWQLTPGALSRAAGIELPVLEHAIRLYRYTCALWHLVKARTDRL